MAALARTLGIFGAFVAVVGAAFYPIYFRPLLLPEEYSESVRAGSWPACGPVCARAWGSAGGAARERTVNKPSWYCSRGYSACRVKSVVRSIWKKVTGSWMNCKTEDGRLQLLLLSLKCVFRCHWSRILNMLCGHLRSNKGYWLESQEIKTC
ncbi:small integral membrane protein 20 isoform X1 [Lonchura striata]